MGVSPSSTAWQEGLGRHVAVKVLLADLSDESDARRFQRECAVLGKLGQHRHVVDVYDAGVTRDRRPYITMRYYSRGTLADQVQATGPIPAAEAVSMLYDLAEAVQAGHDLGVVHRDIKPDNVLIDDEGSVLLADFGVAAWVDDTHTRTSSGAFSTAYAAPEVLDENRYSVASDVYALGATGYALVSGREPFHSTTGIRQMMAIANDPPEPITAPGVPERLKALLLKAMAKDPDERPGSAREFAKSLTASISGSTKAGTGGSTSRVDGPGNDDRSDATVLRDGIMARSSRSQEEAPQAVRPVEDAGDVPPTTARGSPVELPARVSPLAKDGQPAHRGTRRVAITLMAVGGVLALVIGVLIVFGQNAGNKSPTNIVAGPTSMQGAGANPSASSMSAAPAAMVTQVAVGKGPRSIAISPDGGTAYVTNYFGDNISTIDLGTQTVVNTSYKVRNPWALALSDDGRTMYITNYGNSISSRRTADDNGVATRRIGDLPWDVEMSPDESVLYVSHFLLKTAVTMVSPDDLSRIGELEVGRDTSGLALTPDGQYLYAANYHDDSLSVVDVTSGVVEARIRVGKGPEGVAISPDGATVYVANADGNSLSVVDASTRRVVRTVKVKHEPKEPVVSPDGHEVYVSQIGSSSLAVVEQGSDVVSRTIDVGGTGPWGLALSRDGKTIYTANYWSNDISIIRLA